MCFPCSKKKKENESDKAPSQQSHTVENDVYMFPIGVDEGKWQRMWGRSWVRNQSSVRAGRQWSKSQAAISAENGGGKAINFPHSRWDGEKFVPAECMPQPMIQAKITPMKEGMKAWKVEKGHIKADKKTDVDQPVVDEKFSSAIDPTLADTGGCHVQSPQRHAGRWESRRTSIYQQRLH